MPGGFNRTDLTQRITMKTKADKRIKVGSVATLNRSQLPTLIAAELSDYHAYNSARVVGRIDGRTRLGWADGHKAWFDDEAVVILAD